MSIKIQEIHSDRRAEAEEVRKELEAIGWDNLSPFYQGVFETLSYWTFNTDSKVTDFMLRRIQPGL